MNNILRKMRSLLLGKEDLFSAQGYPSLQLALQSLFGARLYRKLLKVSPDRRQLIEEAARLRDISEDEMIKLLSEKLDLPVFFKPKPIDLKVLPAGITAKELRQTGVFPLVDRNIICGVVCVDPAELSDLCSLYTGNNIYLSSWNAVLSAIAASEHLYLCNKLREQQEQQKQQEALVLSALEHLLASLIEKGAQSLLLSTNTSQELIYTFNDNNGVLWDGIIEAGIASKILVFLANKMASPDPTIEFNSLDASITVSFDKQQYSVSILQNCQIASAKILQFPAPEKEINKQNYFSNQQQEIQSLGRVLLIDDNETFLEVMKKYLEKQSFEVKTVSSDLAAKQYLALSQPYPPNIIITDLNLGSNSCLSFVKDLKSSAEYKNIPIVVLTADNQTENEISSLNSGADMFISKSKDLKVLSAYLRKLISDRKAA
jgi:CheY-like chemotaxis protein